MTPNRIDLNAAPDNLKALRQWVGYKLVDHEKKRPDGTPKFDKVPKNPHTGKNAKINEASSWNSFEEACDAVGRYQLDGVMFAFTDTDPYAGVDLDDCRSPVTGEIAPWAQRIIELLDSCSEISPSGTGVHIIVRGTLPEKGHKRGGIELYDNSRFFTVTGQHLEGTPTRIERRPVELLTLHAEVFGGEAPKARTTTTAEPRPALEHLEDDAVLNRAFAAKNGEKLRRVWRGDISDYDDDDSAADLGLCSRLAVWTDDADQIERLWLSSPLGSRVHTQGGDPEKTQQRADYRAMTIAKALAGQAGCLAERHLRSFRDDEPAENQDPDLGFRAADAAFTEKGRRAVLELVTSTLDSDGVRVRLYLIASGEAFGPDLGDEADDDGDGGPTYRRIARVFGWSEKRARAAIHSQDADHAPGSPIRIEKRQNAGGLMPTRQQHADGNGNFISRFPLHVIHVDGNSVEALRFIPKCARERPKWGGPRPNSGRKPLGCPDNPEHAVVIRKKVTTTEEEYCKVDAQQIGESTTTTVVTTREYRRNQDGRLIYVRDHLASGQINQDSNLGFGSASGENRTRRLTELMGKRVRRGWAEQYVERTGREWKPQEPDE